MSRDPAAVAPPKRLFVAVFPPRNVQAVLRAAGASLQTAPGGRAVTWVREANLHMTLRFLGDCDALQYTAAAEAMRAAAAAHAPFEIALGPLGAFPEPARASTLWSGIEAGVEPLRALVASLTRSLSRRGFAKGDTAFVPHISLGRLKDPADWTKALATLPAPAARFQVAQLWLVQSSRTPAGSRYQGREQAALGG